ncbi:hypothetical protein RclHR1_04940002 [Rhizophagus clarus]|uniref:Uncharacterized protein n=1 Tax=Rhizophagus clarus TaxID=94130 RepID=A0A2Z6S2V9_9GLOM|nr:hypothetical protein RclHR1_04940002 [Rhizophagus clarus]
MSTSEKYPGQNILISYLKKKGSKSSYNSFLDIIIYHKDVFTTLSSAETCDDLNNTWFFHFLKEAESLLDQDAFLIVYAENLRYEKKWQIFWQEQKKENLVPAITESTESNIVIPAATESSRPENESAKQKEKKRTRDTNDTYTDDLSSTAHESLIAGNIIPFIKVLKTRLLARSQMSLSSANESVLQAIIENILPLNCYIPELSLVIDGKVANYSSSGVFDKRVRITKSNSNPSKLIGFVILVIGFRRILWKPVDEVMSNYIYDKV